MAIFLHWIGCIWYAIVSYSTIETWIPPKDLENGYSDFKNDTRIERYFLCIYYTLLMILGTEMAPRTYGQTFYCAFIEIFGAMFMAYFFGKIATGMSVI